MRRGQLLRFGIVMAHVCIQFKYSIYVCMWVSVHLQHGVDEVCWECVRRQDFMLKNLYTWFSCKHAVAFKHLCLWVEAPRRANQRQDWLHTLLPLCVGGTSAAKQCAVLLLPVLTAWMKAGLCRTVTPSAACSAVVVILHSNRLILDSLLRSHVISWLNYL